MALQWQEVNCLSDMSLSTYRAKVPGGWLVWTGRYDQGGLTFYPDPNHEWDGNSLP